MPLAQNRSAVVVLTCTLVAQGTLIRYGPAACNVAFVTGKHPRHLVLVGGLTDGLLAVPYTQTLAKHLDSLQVSTVQPLLSSSHTGWGLSSLDRDAEELHALAQHLAQQLGSRGMVLMGHSTGCQDGVRYAERYAQPRAQDGAAAPLLGVVLQAPVSDREWLATQPDTVGRLQRAEAMVAAGQGEEVCFRAVDIDGAAMSARRFCSLAGRGGDDDMFSSDFSDAQLQAALRGLQGVPTLVALSGADEYVPQSVDYAALGARLAAAIGPSAELVVVPGAGHSCKGREDEITAAVAAFVVSKLI